MSGSLAWQNKRIMKRTRKQQEKKNKRSVVLQVDMGCVNGLGREPESRWTPAFVAGDIGACSDDCDVLLSSSGCWGTQASSGIRFRKSSETPWMQAQAELAGSWAHGLAHCQLHGCAQLILQHLAQQRRLVPSNNLYAAMTAATCMG